MTTLATQIQTMSTAETALVSFDLRGKLASDETVASIVSVTPSPAGPTITNKTVSTSVLTIEGESVPIGQAIQFLITSVTAGTLYTITAVFTTSSSPTQTRDGALRIKVDS